MAENSRAELVVCTILLDRSFRILGFNETARDQLALSEADLGSDLRQDRGLAALLPDDQAALRQKTARLFGREYICRLQASVGDGEERLELSVVEPDSSKAGRSQTESGSVARPSRAQAAGGLDADFIRVLGHELRNPLAAIQSGLDLWRLAEESPEKARWVRETIEQQTRLLSRIVDEFVDLAGSGGAASELRKAIERPMNRPNRYAGDQARPAPPRVAAPHRILIIDDNRALAEGLGFLLSQAGHSVRMAFDGRSGLALALDSRPDFVLLDIGLPDLDGYEVAASLRAKFPDANLRIVAISGYSMETHHQRPDRSVFDDFLLKPISLSLVASLLGDAGSDMTNWATAGPGASEEESRQPGKSMPCRVLVVEDNQAVADLTKELLEAHGYEVDLANTAEEAIGLAYQFKPNVVLCDLNLSGQLTGWDVAQTIRARMKPKPLLIAISAYSAEVLKAALKGSAFDAQMQKPLDMELFEAVLSDRHVVIR